MRIGSLVACGLLCALTGCGASGDTGKAEEASEAPAPPSGAEIGQSQQYVVWLPITDPINVEHYKWHTGNTAPTGGTLLPCGSAGVRTGAGSGASCGSFSGKDFLRFHRDFLRRLTDKHAAAGRPASERAPWLSITDDAAMFNQLAQAQKDAFSNLSNGIDPATSQPFANEEAFGTYMETALHNFLHGATQAAHPTDTNTSGVVVTGTIGPLSASPTSTFFFKIHGLVELMYERWQRNKLIDGKYSNLIFRNTSDGTNRVATVNYNASTGVVSQASSASIRSFGISSCNWYIGGVADFDFDGNNDVVWHAPGCSGPNLRFWKMDGPTEVAIMDQSIANVSNDWRLIGAQDFNMDLRPDLVWQSQSTNTLAVWIMSGLTPVNVVTYTMPSGFKAVAIGNATSGAPNLIARNGSTTKIVVPDSSGNIVTSFNISAPVADIFTAIGAVGHYHNTALTQQPTSSVDIAWFHLADSSVSVWTTDIFAGSYSDRGNVPGVPGGVNWLAGAR